MQRVQLQQAMQNRRARLIKQQGTPPSSCNSEEARDNLQLTQKESENDQFIVSYSVPYLQSKIPLIVDESLKPDESEISLAQRQVTFAPTETLQVQSSQFTIQSPQSRKYANHEEIAAIDDELKELQELYKSTSIYSSVSGSSFKNKSDNQIARPGNVLSDGKSSKNNVLAQNFNNNMYGNYKLNSQSDTISQLNTSPLRTQQSRSKSASYNSQQMQVGSLSRSQNFSTTSNFSGNYNSQAANMKNSVSDILTDKYNQSESNATIKEFLRQQELRNDKPKDIKQHNQNLALQSIKTEQIPRQNSSNDKLKQQIIQQEKIIMEYRDECERLQKQVQAFQQQIPADERSKDGLIQRLKQDVINLRAEGDAYREKYEQTIRELVIEVQKLGDLNEEKKFMLIQLNEAVTGQKKRFDFEMMLIQVQKWASESASGENNDKFLIEKVQEAAEDLQLMKNEIQSKNKTIAEQKARLLELEGQVLKGATHASLKQELANKMKQLEKKNDEVNQLRKELLETNAKLLKQTKAQNNPQSVQRSQVQQKQNEMQMETLSQEKVKYEATISTLQEQVKLLQQKLLNQDEEHLKRLKSMSHAEDERVSKIRTSMDDQLIDLRRRINDLTLENELAKQKAANAESRYENLVKQYEVEKMQEHEKRLNRLEAVPESKYMNDVVQRAVLAENQLKVEREMFSKTCQHYQAKLQEYQQEIQQLVQELEYLM